MFSKIGYWLSSFITLLAFYTFTSLYFIIALPVLLLPLKIGWYFANAWLAINLAIYKYIGGMTFEIRGIENIPSNQKGYIVAAKHQSAWETIGLAHIFKHPAYILKKELLMLPLFGFYLKKFQMIPIDRSKGKKAMDFMLPFAATSLKNKRPLLIFPEGTRTSPGAPPRYKHGFAKLYTDLDSAIVPVALNTGFFWPKKSFTRYRGKIIVSILPAIEPGLSHQEVYEKIISSIEVETDKLAIETAKAHPDLPTVKAYNKTQNP